MSKFQPNLSAKPKKESDWAKIRVPAYLSTKFDGIRAFIPPSYGLVSRTLKPIPNAATREFFERPEFHGLDGELIVGSPFGPDVYRRTVSGVMTRGGDPQAVLYVFDDFTDPYIRYEDRKAFLYERIYGLPPYLRQRVELVQQTRVSDVQEAIRISQQWEQEGYEGGILRCPNASYKFGRSTLTDQGLVKIKFFEDDEAIIVGVEELYSNQNEAELDERGYTKRTSHQENQVPMDTLGALICKSERFEKEFKIGTGFDAQTRADLWTMYYAGELVGRQITYKFQASGTFERPRIPVYKGFRDDV